MSWILRLFSKRNSGMADGFDDVVTAEKITATVLGKQIIRRCGNEGQQDRNSAAQSLVRSFLQAAITFLPHAEEAGVDLSKVTFIMVLPGHEFVLKSGTEWEFLFTLDSQDTIVVGCTNKPFGRFKCNLPNKGYSTAVNKRGNNGEGKPQCLALTQ